MTVFIQTNDAPIRRSPPLKSAAGEVRQVSLAARLGKYQLAQLSVGKGRIRSDLRTHCSLGGVRESACGECKREERLEQRERFSPTQADVKVVNYPNRGRCAPRHAGNLLLVLARTRTHTHTGACIRETHITVTQTPV